MLIPAPSDVVTFQEVGPLKHFNMALVDFEGRAETDRQARQDVTALHQEKRFPINFLLRRDHNYLPSRLMRCSVQKITQPQLINY